MKTSPGKGSWASVLLIPGPPFTLAPKGPGQGLEIEKEDKER